MLRHNSRNMLFFQIFELLVGNILENFDQTKKSLFWHFLVKILKNIAKVKIWKKKKNPGEVS